MSSKRMFWRLFPSFLLITFLLVIAISWYTTVAFEDYYLQQISSDLEVQARLIEPLLVSPQIIDSPDRIDSLCELLGQQSGTRITIIMKNGVVLGDSHEDPAVMERHHTRPELSQALSGQPGAAIRYSSTINKRLMYVALPIYRNDTVFGAIRTSLPIVLIDQALSSIKVKVAVAGVALLIISSLLSFWISRSLSRPLERLKHAAEHYAQGDFRNQLPDSDIEEIDSLARAMNQMAQELNERIQTMEIQQNEQETILASMVEGVVALDTEERVINMNQTAARLFSVSTEEARGKSIHEVVRDSELHQLINETLSSGEPVEGTTTTYTGEGERHLQVHGTNLRDAEMQTIGALVVLNDITNLTKLENLRRDFVANVSHELRTPITSIKGFVETLLNGALNKPSEARRFLDIIARQADRLNAIIEDLLSLSRLEQEAEQGQIVLMEGSIQNALKAAVQSCQLQMEARRINIQMSCEPDLSARMNSQMVEQALTNLLDNAIKYSLEGGVIEMSAEAVDSEIQIRVRDYGPGIEAKHFDRLFERFYRVDKARSRDMGGTGLGLAIVKHIMKTHDGTVSVKSTVGKGSTFTLHLPTDLRSTP